MIKEEISGIRGRMAQIGVTQQELALSMGYERSAITRYLTGVRPMPEGMEARIHATLDGLEEEKRVAAEAVEKLRAERAAQEARERVLEEGF